MRIVRLLSSLAWLGVLIVGAGTVLPAGAQMSGANEWAWVGQGSSISPSASDAGLSKPAVNYLPQNGGDASPGSAESARRIESGYRALPLSFEQNLGQVDSQVHFLARGAGFAILAKDKEAILELSQYGPEHSTPRRLDRGGFDEGQRQAIKIDQIRMQLAGASGKMELMGDAPLPGTVNYFVGADSAKWHLGISTFAKLRYRGVYPGVDLVYYGSANRLEFDFEIAPRASTSNIRLLLAGARRLELDQDGNLVVLAEHGQIKFHQPVIYQVEPDQTRRKVTGRFRVFSDNTVGFTLGVYDRSRPLVIDPILDYSTYLGSVSGAAAIAVDSAGEAFVAGYAGAGMPTTPGSYQATYPAAGKNDNTGVGSSFYTETAAFVEKFNSSGTALVYCTYLSGSLNDAADAIAVDSSGNAYVAGATASPDFPVTTGAFQTSNRASRNGTGFIAELDNSGSGLIYSTFLGGSQAASITGLALDGSGNVFVTGYTADLDFPVTPGAFQTASPVNPIIGGKGFITKMASGGQHLLYSTYIGGSRWDLPYGIAIDSSGNAYIAGGTQSQDFPTTPGAFQTVNKATVFNLLGGSFVSKLNAAGSALVYSTYLDGSYTDVANAITVDTNGSAYVTGFATSPDFPITPGVFEPNLDLSPIAEAFEMSNVFITKLNPSGSSLVYSTFLGGKESYNQGAYGDVGLGIAVDSSGNAYIAGSTGDLDFPVTSGALQTQNITQFVSQDLASFVTKINPTASAILYSTFLTGTGDQSGDQAGVSCDCAAGIVLDSSNNVYVAGRTVSTDFPTTMGAPENQSEYGVSGFVAKFDAAEMQQLPLTTTTLTASANPQMYGQPVTFTATVKGTSGSTPTGTVGFSYQGLLANGTPYAFGAWNDVAVNGAGVAEFTTSSLPSGWIGNVAGPIGVVAFYLGDAKNSPSEGSMEETINRIPTTTTITADPSSAPYGTPITFTATVVETASGKPSQGSVSFDVGSTSFEFVALDSAGEATWTSGALGAGGVLPAGAQTMTAEYSTLDGAGDQWSQGSVTVNITALNAAATPTFSVAGGTYATNQSVGIMDATSGATIYYTTDGSAPNTGSAVYGGPIPVNSTETVEAIAVASGYSASAVATATYTIPQSFTLSIDPASITVAAGASGTSTIKVQDEGGFNENVSFACSGLPAGAACGFTLLTVPTQAGVSYTTLTVTTASTTADVRRGPGGLFPGAALAVVVCCFGLRKRRVLMLVVLAVGLGVLGGCGGAGSGGGGTQPVTSTVTVTATSGLLTQSTTFTLTVN